MRQVIGDLCGIKLEGYDASQLPERTFTIGMHQTALFASNM
jgi:hypothetical protein